MWFKKNLYYSVILFVCSVSCLLAQNSAETKHAQKDSYPTDQCIVSDEKLGEHGKPYVYLYKAKDNREIEVRFCCKGCLKDFNKDPDVYLKKLEEAKKVGDEKNSKENTK